MSEANICKSSPYLCQHQYLTRKNFCHSCVLIQILMKKNLINSSFCKRLLGVWVHFIPCVQSSVTGNLGKRTDSITLECRQHVDCHQPCVQECGMNQNDKKREIQGMLYQMNMHELISKCPWKMESKYMIFVCVYNSWNPYIILVLGKHFPCFFFLFVFVF